MGSVGCTEMLWCRPLLCCSQAGALRASGEQRDVVVVESVPLSSHS